MFKTNQTKERNMSNVYDDFGNLKNNCLTVTPTSEPINIRGSRSDSNWCIEAVGHDLKIILTLMQIVFSGQKKKH